MGKTSVARVVVIAPGYSNYDEERAALQGRAVIEELFWDGDRQRLADGLRTADLIFVRDARIDAGLVAELDKARGILRYGVGYDTVDTDAARSRKIYVTNVPDYGAATDVSDHAAALLLGLARRITVRDRAVRNGGWNIGQAEPVHRIRGQTLGLVGYGKIARELHRKMLAFGVGRVLVFDPFLDTGEIARAGGEAVTLISLMSQSDLISLHAPGRSDGAPLIDAEALAAVKTGANLVNTARGTLIDETALIGALTEGRLGGAGLDVVRDEPLASDSPLRSAPNLVLTDHAGWYSESSVRELQRQVGQQASAILDGRIPDNWVNPW